MAGFDVGRFERHLATVVVPRVSCDQTRNVRTANTRLLPPDGFCASRRIFFYNIVYYLFIYLFGEPLLGAAAAAGPGDTSNAAVAVLAGGVTTSSMN